MSNIHLEKVFFHCCLDQTQYIEFVDGRFFDDTKFKKLYGIVKDFWKKYSEVPTISQVKEIVKLKGYDDELTEPQLAAIWDIDLSQYDDEWLKVNTQCWIEYKNLELSTSDLVTFLKTTQINTENIRTTVDKAKSIILDRNNINFDFEEGSDFFDPESHKQPIANTFSSGFPFIDQVSDGGFASKTLTILIGAPKVGKSIWLANVAAQAVRLGNNVCVVSFEMAEAKYIRRLGSNLLGIRMDEYKNIANNDQELIRKKLKNFGLGSESLRIPGKLTVKEFPTSSASVIDVENYLKGKEEKSGVKYKIIVLDYINIMKNWRNPNSENTYMKIKQIAEDVRAMAQRNDWAVVSATQVKQSFFDSNDMSMEAVAESSALVATVDLMFGIIQNPLMHAEKKYKLKVLANRDEGWKNCIKFFDIDYNYMKLMEDSTPIIDGTNDFT